MNFIASSKEKDLAYELLESQLSCYDFEDAEPLDRDLFSVPSIRGRGF